jgi:hypothetical protein
MSSLCGPENLIGRTGHGNVGDLFNFGILWSAFMRDTHRHGLQRPRDSGGAFRETEMSWGNALYVGATALAGLIVLLVAANYIYNIDQNRPLIPFVPLLIAGVIWLIGFGTQRLLDNQ